MEKRWKQLVTLQLNNLRRVKNPDKVWGLCNDIHATLTCLEEYYTVDPNQAARYRRWHAYWSDQGVKYLHLLKY